MVGGGSSAKKKEGVSIFVGKQIYVRHQEMKRSRIVWLTSEEVKVPSKLWLKPLYIG